MQTLPERLRWARETAGLTTRDLATVADVAHGYPSAIECDKVGKPSADALKKLADALGVSFEWLYWGSGKRPDELALQRRGKRTKAAIHKGAA